MMKLHNFQHDARVRRQILDTLGDVIACFALFATTYLTFMFIYAMGGGQ